MSSPDWWLSDRADPAALPLADAHYNRQKPGTPQFVPPGKCLVLLTADRSALWVSSWPKAEFVKHAWPGAWINSLFRKEGDGLASDMIRQAVAHTRHKWPEVPDLGMVTFVDPTKIRSSNPGYCYRMAGFKHVGYTKSGLWAWQMVPGDMPDAEPAAGTQGSLF